MANLEITIKELSGYTPVKSHFYVTISIETEEKKTHNVEWTGEPLAWNEYFVLINFAPEAALKISVFQDHTLPGSEECQLIGEKPVKDIPADAQSSMLFKIIKLLLTFALDLSLSLKSLGRGGNATIGEATLLVSVKREIKIHATAESAAGGIHMEAIIGKENIVTKVTETVGPLATPEKLQSALDPFEPLRDKIDAFVKLTEKIGDLHPYAKITIKVVLIWKAQRDRDQKIVALVRTMNEQCVFLDSARPLESIVSQKEILQKFMKQIIECSEFIRRYVQDKDLVIRLLKNLVSNVDERIQQYQETFTALRKAFNEESQLQSQILLKKLNENVTRIGLGIDWNDMPYAGGARYRPSLCCLPGTRIDILQQISDWSMDLNHVQCILLLMGPAGSGKSAIAHSMAKTFDGLSQLGSSFCFSRNDTSRTPALLFPTLARDLAQRDPGFKNVLAKVIQDRSLRKTGDINEQFNQFIVKSSSQSTFFGHRLIVIDALDECGGDQSQRTLLLRILADPEIVKKIPSDVRILITTRPEVDILDTFRNCPHVHTMLLAHDTPVAQTRVTQDIFTFVHHELLQDPTYYDSGIEENHCHQTTEKAQGLFQWASVVCKVLKGGGGSPPLEELESLLAVPGDIPALYETALRRNINIMNPKTKERFQLVVGFILSTSIPLPESTLNVIWKAYGGTEAVAAAKFLLKSLNTLFHGILDDGPIIPIHTSVRDYLTNSTLSGDFFIQTEKYHEGLGVATLQIMVENLHFNMCNLNNSHIPNAAITDLEARLKTNIPSHLEYSCRCIRNHLYSLSWDMIKSKINEEQSLISLIRNILEEKFFFWLEVLGLLKAVDSAYLFLATILDKLKDQDFQISALAKDGIRFIRMASSVIEDATPHIYLSAMSFLPLDSNLRKSIALHSSEATSAAIDGLQKLWPCLEQTIQYPGIPFQVAFSPDNRRIACASSDTTVSI
ncbi:hypothetical protein M422DRAFT_261578 [Sphaerobolus stellatus SS14]|uniref:NACHT domain-containing protein n=1 Tax=Sphaerobolus stellatus (strain SS14) TaxID=990650 RepID=A0A0C9UMF2_SPHS4|nr:hypothetical protein M422DRAFT_261578 [Sphaerobolus stellatus SS14]